MPVSGISQSNASAYTEGANTNLGLSELGYDDFLTLLTAQLQNQNLFEPTNDTEFIAQMAQFSTLQQMNKLTSMFENSQAVSYLGKNVIARDVDSDGNECYISGVVDSINFENNTPFLLINNKYYEVSAITDMLNELGDSSSDEVNV